MKLTPAEIEDQLNMLKRQWAKIEKRLEKLEQEIKENNNG